jgi:methionyl-tRNA synthetase
MKRVFISTAIPYVNAKPHLGHALEFVQADAAARYWRLREADVFFVTGTDENALKNVRAAETTGIPPQEFVDQNAEHFRTLIKTLSLSPDDFIRTTEARHIAGAQKLWTLCEKDIYKKKYRGLYCVGCEQFYKESELEHGLCPEHKTAPEMIEEENYFFRLSSYQKQLEELLEKNRINIVPEHRKNEMLSFVRSGLEDFSVSRSRARAREWGIPVPGDDSQIIYVWFDALTNYINALGFGSDKPEKFESYWNTGGEDETIHMIGKGVLRFHAIYWPAMLLSAKLKPPSKIVVHGYLTSSGDKMSKSIGNVVSPFDLVNEWGADAVRYFLLREVPSFEDGDYSPERFAERYNADLSHGLGNLVSRTLTMISKNPLTIGANELEKQATEWREKYDSAMRDFRFNVALESAWGLIGEADRYINTNKPWELAKNDPERFVIVASSLWATLRAITLMLRPLIPETAEKILKALAWEKSDEPPQGTVITPTRPDNLFPPKVAAEKK